MEEMEANSNVCCNGRGMLQWELEKLTPKRGEPGTAPRQDLGGSVGGAEGSGLIRSLRRQGIATLITTGIVVNVRK